MATESPGEAHAGDGVDLASGNDSDTATDAEGVGGDTDDEVPEGENYFGRASKEGAAPTGANPFAAASSAPEDDWAAQIAEAKAMVEAQRIAREKEEAIEREREKAAAELKGKTYEGRRKAGDPAPETNAASSGGGGSAHSRVRKMLKARRPLGGGEKKDTPEATPAPFAFGATLLAPTPDANKPDANKPPAASPFAGFSLLGSQTAPVTESENTKNTTGSPVAADNTDPPKSGGVFTRLSGAPAPFHSPEVAIEEVVEVSDDEEENASDASEASDGVQPNVVPLFAASPLFATVSKKSVMDEKRDEADATPTTTVDPSTAEKSATGNRTPLAVELDL